MEIESHAEDLASDLGVDKTEVKEDLENLLAYSVPIDEAKQSLRRKYGGGDGDGSAPSATAIHDITTESGSATVTVTVLTVGTRRIQYQGDDHVIREGAVADESGRISYTAWDDFDVEPGDTVTIGNASVREWEGKPELNIGEHTSVSVADETLSIPHEVGGDTLLRDLEPGDRGRNVEVQVLDVESRTIDGRDGKTDILSGVLGDETARLPFTDWDPHDAITDGASLRLENVYVREFRGVPSVNVSEFTEVSVLDDGVEPGGPTELPIRDAVDSGGVYDVALAGNIIEIRDGSGLIQRCPECGRVVQKGQCRQHGAVEGEDDLRVKAILDDGTGTVTVILDDELTEVVYGGDVDDAREQARDAMDQSVVADTIADELVGYEYRVRGHLSVDDFGSNLEATEFERSQDDPAERANALLEEAQP
ncbi:Single-stranded DNA-binding replication protein A (RPA), large (70 kD) subunit or related ssDNA-binding protein [Halanaeroarchaeum sp. HSR-CO]|uniref:Single-stranded DNA binding protein n=1 Tax=Halanaeroarchaeum sp. HSR-CO TaxID=2866382 RepID=UPI00217D2641|nr:Single-stranded DNA binding protein [Halanaeroarchaeum sp. HSR-CO]UWG48299.1 Single-stranded DNA-binding replication protein A (RPA), large (70 kD) subunit or related ssDNA-binding protein [Halanaeroarchaeum sp. HSR-CO]